MKGPQANNFIAEQALTKLTHGGSGHANTGRQKENVTGYLGTCEHLRL